MNTLDTQYKDLLKTILEHGVDKEDRTGTGTKSIFGYTIRHNMREGFPLLTTKKMYFKGIVTELLWFLQGRTDLRYLLQNDCHIWTGDAYKVYDKDFDAEHPPFSAPYPKRLTEQEFEQKIMDDDEFNLMYGDLGPIYGKQWRNWNSGYKKLTTTEQFPYVASEYQQIDQIQNLIKELKTNPDSRRLMVSAWNVGELDGMVLPPCHYGFQVYTRELSLEERATIWNNTHNPVGNIYTHNQYDENDIPARAISLMWNQRSVDTFLGLPFNIASYGLLLEIIAKEVNMVPDQLIGNLGDTHLYSNHIDQAREQIGRDLTVDERMDWWFKNRKPNRELCDHVDSLSPYGKGVHFDQVNVPRNSREPYPLPKLELSDEVKWAEGNCLPSYSTNDIKLLNYQSHPAIKAPLSN